MLEESGIIYYVSQGNLQATQQLIREQGFQMNSFNLIDLKENRFTK